MYKIYFISVLFLASCSIHKLSKENVYKELPAKEYQVYAEDSNVIIIDVRTVSEFQKSHIKNAVNISYFGGHFSKELQTMQLDTSKTVLIYCETQHRSLFVAKKIYAIGFCHIIDLDKGMIQWRKDGFPFVN